MLGAGQRMSRQSSLQGLGSGAPLLLVVVTGEYGLVLFWVVVFDFDGFFSS